MRPGLGADGWVCDSQTGAGITAWVFEHSQGVRLRAGRMHCAFDVG